MRLINHFNVLCTQVCTLMAMFFALEGMAWIESGFGIHPMLAGALACALFLTPHLVERLVDHG